MSLSLGASAQPRTWSGLFARCRCLFLKGRWRILKAQGPKDFHLEACGRPGAHHDLETIANLDRLAGTVPLDARRPVTGLRIDVNPRQLPVARTRALVLLTDERWLPGRGGLRIPSGMELLCTERRGQGGAGALDEAPAVHAGVGMVSQ